MPHKTKTSQKDFKLIETSFTQAIRDPEHFKGPSDIEPERMKLYQDLTYSVMNENISSCFPVLNEILDDDTWSDLISAFIKNHHCSEPSVYHIPYDFLDYLQHYERENIHPALIELAHYEWVELDLEIASVPPQPTKSTKNPDLMTEFVSLSPLCRLLTYQHPVHTLTPDTDFESLTKKDTYLLVYRKENFDIAFMALNALSARLIQLLEHGPTTGDSLLKELQKELGGSLDINKALKTTLTTFYENQVIHLRA